MFRKPDLAKRMMAWSIELFEFDVQYEPMGPIKAQTLARFY